MSILFATFRVKCDSLAKVEEVRAFMARIAGIEEGDVTLEDGTPVSVAMAREIRAVESGEEPDDRELIADGI